MDVDDVVEVAVDVVDDDETSVVDDDDMITVGFSLKNVVVVVVVIEEVVGGVDDDEVVVAEVSSIEVVSVAFSVSFVNEVEDGIVVDDVVSGGNVLGDGAAVVSSEE